MVSLTSATVGLRDQPVELADDGGDLRLQRRLVGGGCGSGGCGGGTVRPVGQGLFDAAQSAFDAADGQAGFVERSEEHTSELQSLMRISYAVFCLKKKKKDIRA